MFMEAVHALSLFGTREDKVRKIIDKIEIEIFKIPSDNPASYPWKEKHCSAIIKGKSPMIITTYYLFFYLLGDFLGFFSDQEWRLWLN